MSYPLIQAVIFLVLAVAALVAAVPVHSINLCIESCVLLAIANIWLAVNYVITRKAP